MAWLSVLESCLLIGLPIDLVNEPIPGFGLAAVFDFQQLSTEPARSY
ncbi:hypothetical protein AVHY2522_21095 [Acidovorax sp. SUPP2522]|nr:MULTISPECIES: hypothetical protein [unclassified Acidovorax]WCM99642.1 hypothetical protein M5C96_09685 [Acidovorax sp. GBBC 1281]GKT19054.1 hypothetical protein AVHY2522_21095 [Acidovorax sp. SUPP2522]